MPRKFQLRKVLEVSERLKLLTAAAGFILLFIRNFAAASSPCFCLSVEVSGFLLVQKQALAQVEQNRVCKPRNPSWSWSLEQQD